MSIQYITILFIGKKATLNNNYPLFYEAFYPYHFLTIKIILFSKTNLNALCSLMTTPEIHLRAVIRLPYPGTKCFGNSVL